MIEAERYNFQSFIPVRLDVRKMAIYLPLSSDAYLEIGMKDLRIFTCGESERKQEVR